MTTPSTMTTSVITTATTMLTDVVVAPSLWVEVEVEVGVGVGVGGVGVGVDAVERKHNMTWHKEGKQGTQTET